MSVNKIILLGHVGKSPEVRAMQNGSEVATFSLATTESWKDKSTGEKHERTEWHNIVIFNKGLVEISRKYVKKGTKLYLEGSLQTKKWTDKNGVEKRTTQVVLQGFNCTLELLSKEVASTSTCQPSKKPVVDEFLDEDTPL